MGMLIATIIIVSWYLVPFWKEQPELSHGFFAPFCSVALLFISARETTSIFVSRRLPLLLLQSTVVLAGLAAGWVATFAAIAQGPLHVQTAFCTGLALSFVIFSGAIVLTSVSSRLVRLNGTSLCAALLWWFAVPLPSGTLARFTLLLQDAITAASVRTLHVLGLPAIRHGNIIQLPHALVGVEEACSGVRSLTACLFAGAVLGGFMLQGWPRRITLMIGAGLIALVANLVRSITLCLLAARGTEIRGFWHDTTAYAVLGATAVVLFGACLLLASNRDNDAEPAAPLSPVFPFAKLNGTLHFILVGCLALLLVSIILKTAPALDAEPSPPDLAALVAFEQPGWQHRTDESILSFAPALRTPWLRQETYRRGDTQMTFFAAYWPTRQATLGAVAIHAPDICLPGSGWTSHPPPAPISRYPLPDPRRFAFTQGDFPQYVWFWHYFDGHVVADTPWRYLWQLSPFLLRRATRTESPQWVIRVSSNLPLESLRDEPLLKTFFARVHAAGLDGELPLK
jgi:exosortase